MDATSADLNSGIRGALLEKKHSDAMGEAIWLFGWLLTRQTKPDGLVFGGHHFTYSEIAEASDWPVRTLQRWMARLQLRGYVRVKHTSYKRMLIWICNPKKFGARQLSLAISYPPNVADLKSAGKPPHMADIAARSGGSKERSVVGAEKSKDKPRANTPRVYTASEMNQAVNEAVEKGRKIAARGFRIEKEDAAKREALVGAPPMTTQDTRVRPAIAQKVQERSKPVSLSA